ncbi:MAG: sigma-70 family RNA polymerase sigma factor [Clostridia bacterium]|nr:sigma-70 family RNA polymerase sigma factor [Clostridia bacterium]
MDFFKIYQAAGHAGAVLPLAILMIESDDDREFVTRIFTEHKRTIYYAAREYFDKDDNEIEDVIGITVERICKYCSQVRKIPESKMRTYIISMTGNVCRDMLRKRKKRSDLFDYSISDKSLESIPSEYDLEATVFDIASAKELINAFDQLPVKERELIRMHHMDGVAIKDIASELDATEGAIRTALSRARKHLLEIVKIDREAIE